jgi:hypothetical protein
VLKKVQQVGNLLQDVAASGDACGRVNTLTTPYQDVRNTQPRLL